MPAQVRGPSPLPRLPAPCGRARFARRRARAPRFDLRTRSRAHELRLERCAPPDCRAQQRPSHPRVPLGAAPARSGGVGVIPTDTMYAIVCDVESREAVERLYEARRKAPLASELRTKPRKRAPV